MAIVIHFAALFDEGQSTQGHMRKMLHRGLDICLDLSQSECQDVFWFHRANLNEIDSVFRFSVHIKLYLYIAINRYSVCFTWTCVHTDSQLDVVFLLLQDFAR